MRRMSKIYPDLAKKDHATLISSRISESVTSLERHIYRKQS